MKEGDRIEITKSDHLPPGIKPGVYRLGSNMKLTPVELERRGRIRSVLRKLWKGKEA